MLDNNSNNKILLLFAVTSIQGIYNYVPETNHVSRVQSDAAMFWIQFMLCVMIFPLANVCTFILVLSEVYAQCAFMAVCCSSLKSCFSVMLFKYFMNYEG